MNDLPNPRRDLLLLYVARAARNFGDGFAVIVLPAYLSAIGASRRTKKLRRTRW